VSEAPAAAPPLVGKTWVYRLGRLLVKSELVLLHRLRVAGTEHLPAGGALLVANHQSFLDIPVIASSTRRHVAFVARDTLSRSRFLAWVMRESGTVLIRRGTSDRAALRAMVEHLTHGDLVAVFPEGTRTRDGSLQAFKGGAFLAARMAEVPLIPAAIQGSFEALPRGAKFPRPAGVSIRYGAALDPADPAAPERAREAIAALIAARGRAPEPS
jgi:1-acyl-sn-glycerol-3-phosphate acyltransferase